MYSFYSVSDPHLHTAVHVGQIYVFVKFNDQLKMTLGALHKHAPPLGFNEFAEAWNTGARPNDPRRMCQIIMTEENDIGYRVNIPVTTVKLTDFHLSLHQVGMSPTHQSVSYNHQEIIDEFNAIAAEQRLNPRHRYEEICRERLNNAALYVNQSTPSDGYARRNNPKFRPAASTSTSSIFPSNRASPTDPYFWLR